MEKEKYYWKKWTKGKMIGGGLIALSLLLCVFAWRGLRQKNTTLRLQDIYKQARTDNIMESRGEGRQFTIHMEGENDWTAQYDAAELSDEQFAALKNRSVSWEKQQARVSEAKIPKLGAEGFCGNGFFEEKELEKARVYQMKDRACYYLLVEDGETGGEYLAKYHQCSDQNTSMADVLRNFLQIGGEGDINSVTLEDTRGVEYGGSNIMGIFMGEKEKAQFYRHLCEIPLGEMYYDEGLLLDEVYGTIFPEAVKEERYLIGLENRQGETLVIQYQKADEVDYICAEGEEMVDVYRVPKEQMSFWRQVFEENARPDAAEEECQSTQDEDMSEMRSAKPVIYLYPQKTEDISVKVDNIDFTAVYPDYQDGWRVRAEKDGTLHMYQRDGKTLDEGREYYALYYEGNSEMKPDWRNGFTVQKTECRTFLEEKLRILGLSDREAEEFILYWLPKLERYPAVDVHFTEQSVLDDMVPLTISPMPQTTIRVFMQWRPHIDGAKLPEQKLSPVARKGYTAVEWGGSGRDEG